MNKIWIYIKTNKLITVLNIFILLIFILPNYHTYMDGPLETDILSWKPQYIYDYDELLMAYLPLLILTILFQVLRHNIWRKLALGLLVLTSGLSALLYLLSALMPSQDYSPSSGQYLTILLFPLLLIIWKIDSRDEKLTLSKIST